MNVLEAIQIRRAVRAYTSEVIDEATVRRLLDAAVLAPNAMNEQAWLFSVVQNKDTLKRWSDRAKSLLLDQTSADPKTQHYNPLLIDPNFNIFYDAGTLVVIASKVRGTYTDADCWLAAENLMLAACEIGLGSCPIGFAVPVLNTPQVKKELNLPESAVAVAPIIVGRPRTMSARPPRSAPQVTTWLR
ncbi:MAG TPA: nitroreductase family protein [Polyangiaceae bacterium]